MLKKMTIFAATTLWLVSSLYAQSGSTLRGQVLDPGQDAMAGVTISITSEQMPGKKTTITDSEGNYVFLGLAPGIYEVEAQANGFKPIKKTGVQLRVGQTITLPITLEVGQVQGTVVVKASEDTPIIDTTNPENNFNVSGEFINKLPLSTRQSWEGLWFLVPGAVTIGTNGPDGVNYDPTINGASQRSNAYKLNGFEIGNAFTNQGWTTQFSTEAIQDVVIKTGGGDASSSLGQGGAVNVVTKSGGNKFSGSAGVFFQPKQFNWTNVPGGTSSTLTLYQPDLSFGGPILKDRLWFFTTYRNVLTNEGVPRSVTVLDRFRQFGLTPPDFEKLERSNRFTGKLSYRLNDDHSLTFNYLNDAGKVINSDAREQGTLESAVDILSGGGTYQIAWTGNLSPRLLLTAQYGYRRLNNTVNIKGGDDPARTLFETTIISAGNRAGSGATLLFYGNRSFGFATASRGLRPHHEVTSDLTYITNLKGQHTFQVGLQFKPESRIESFNVLPASGLGLVEETLVNGQRVPFHRQFRNPIEYPSIVGDTAQKGFYVQDLGTGQKFDRQLPRSEIKT